MGKPRFVSNLELRARRKRFALFEQLASSSLEPAAAVTILDVGGTWQYWSQFGLPKLEGVKVVLFNIFPQDPEDPTFTALVGDGRDLSRFRDNEFDLVYSNSVLPFVGTLADQGQMAREIRRVGRRYFVQTPNRFFVLDWRTLVPFFHWLPAAAQAWCFRRFKVGIYPRLQEPGTALHHATRVRDLTASELRELFPGATVVRERVLGLTKSFLIHSGFKR